MEDKCEQGQMVMENERPTLKTWLIWNVRNISFSSLAISHKTAPYAVEMKAR